VIIGSICQTPFGAGITGNKRTRATWIFLTIKQQWTVMKNGADLGSRDRITRDGGVVVVVKTKSMRKHRHVGVVCWVKPKRGLEKKLIDEGVDCFIQGDTLKVVLIEDGEDKMSSLVSQIQRAVLVLDRSGAKIQTLSIGFLIDPQNLMHSFRLSSFDLAALSKLGREIEIALYQSGS
jgi:hypothetical protein